MPHPINSHQFFQHFSFWALTLFWLNAIEIDASSHDQSPYVGLPVIPICSKVMSDCCVTHHTSPSLFGGLRYLHGNFSLYTTKVMMFPSSHWLLVWLVPGVGTVWQNMGTCVVSTATTQQHTVVGKDIAWLQHISVCNEWHQGQLAACFVLCHRRLH